MPGSLKRIAASAAVFGASLGVAWADEATPVVDINYDPATRGLTIAFEARALPDKASLKLPDWLAWSDTNDNQSLHLVGTLPDLEDATATMGASPRGAFLFGGLHWMSDIAGLSGTDIRVTTPAPFKAIATGNRVSETNGADFYSGIFRQDQDWSSTDLFFGPYDILKSQVETSQGPVELRTYFKEDEAKLSQDYLAAVRTYLADYSEQIGPYPNDGFAVVSAPIPVGYAFDGLTYVSEQILNHPYMLGRSLAHEVLHNWWGSGVRINYGAGNWAEGITTYQADYALAEAQGADAAKAMRRTWLASLTSLSKEQDQPLRTFRAADHNSSQAVGYGKSAMVFHALRNDLGEDVFNQSLRVFWKDQNGKRASWGDLQSAFEATSERDLGAFFEQWLERPGLPKITLKHASAETSDNGYLVTIDLEQSNEPFSLRLPLVIETVAGEVETTVFLDGPTQTFSITTSERPTAVSVDPDFNALRALIDGELPVAIREVLGAKDVVLLTNDVSADRQDAFLANLFSNPDKVSRLGADQSVPDTAAIVVIGTRDRVLASREGYFDSQSLKSNFEGDADVWVELDDQERPWLFATSEDLGALPDRVATLRYYGGRSYVSYPKEGRATAGRWPVTDSPLRIEFD